MGIFISHGESSSLRLHSQNLATGVIVDCPAEHGVSSGSRMRIQPGRFFLEHHGLVEILLNMGRQRVCSRGNGKRSTVRQSGYTSLVDKGRFDEESTAA